jgi:hypothetical protein
MDVVDASLACPRYVGNAEELFGRLEEGVVIEEDRARRARGSVGTDDDRGDVAALSAVRRRALLRPHKQSGTSQCLKAGKAIRCGGFVFPAEKLKSRGWVAAPIPGS